MRRADRLFEIIQILRRKRATRAIDLAALVEVSERTIYRDIRDMVSSGVPILRHAIRDQRKIRFTFEDIDDQSTERVVRQTGRRSSTISTLSTYPPRVFLARGSTP
jgi:predicted DNA-binding transcriptional regulator YafY